MHRDTQPGYAVQCLGLTKRFVTPPGVARRHRSYITAVDRVSLEIGRQEVFGLVGPNGAGKTTLIKLLTTLITPDAGSATVAGIDVTSKPRSVRWLVGLVSSNDRSFYWRLTGKQNLRFFASLYRRFDYDAVAWIEELIDALELRSIIDRRYQSYSTGERQRIAIARGLISKPRILFMDEPTAGLDPVAVADLVELLRRRVTELWRPTIVVTSHDLAYVEAIADRVALMKSGRVFASGTLDQLRAMANIPDRLELRVAGMQRATLARICRAAGARHIDMGQHGDVLQVDVTFPFGAAGLPRLTRLIVEANAQLVWCSQRGETLRDVFHAIVGRWTD